jgi:hypothetical protein
MHPHKNSSITLYAILRRKQILRPSNWCHEEDKNISFIAYVNGMLIEAQTLNYWRTNHEFKWYPPVTVYFDFCSFNVSGIKLRKINYLESGIFYRTQLMCRSTSTPMSIRCDWWTVRWDHIGWCWNVTQFVRLSLKTRIQSSALASHNHQHNLAHLLPCTPIFYHPVLINRG